MGSTIYLPKKINVGYQNRDDTYTGKLAYVIYYDAKGKLRKEASWNSWRDEDIPSTEFTNEPTEGFVLNKKVGGYSTGWDHRATYTRVYDPRGFEFEITVPNLLYILQNTDCIKGKGLTGKFVYGWDGTELLLIPEGAPEFAKYAEYTSLLETKDTVKAKDLIPGARYLTNKNNEVTYLGRFDEWTYKYHRERKSQEWYSKGKMHFFYSGRCSWRSKDPNYMMVKSVPGRILTCVDPNPVENYADLMDELECQTCYSPYDSTKDERLPVTEEVMSARDSKTVYFMHDGVEWKSGLHKKDDDVNLWQLSDPQRVEPLYSPRPSYWGWQPEKPDEVKVKLCEQMKAKGHYYIFYNKDEKGVPLKELIETYQPTYIKEYLRNGKENK